MSVPVAVAAPFVKPARSNSISSATAPRTIASSTSRNAPRTSYLRGRSASPDSVTRVLQSMNSSRPDSRDRKPTSYNVNRWSHSTNSSGTGLDTDLIRKRTSSSGAIRRSVIGITMGTNDVSTADQSHSGKNSPRKSNAVRMLGPSSADGSRLNFQDSSNVNVVRDLSHNNGVGPVDHSAPAWEHRSGLNKFGEPVSGLSIQYTEAAQFQSLPNGATLPERRSSSGRPGHRDRSANRSKDNSKTSVTSGKSDQSRKGHRSPQQKDMLSKALAKANTAVLLDNAQDITGAIAAYEEACRLLEQVMLRSNDPEDRRKLSAIQSTYTSRIAELRDLDQTLADIVEKALPDDPPSDEFDGPEEYFHDDSSFRSRTSRDPAPNVALPLRQESLLPQIFGGESYLPNPTLPATQNHLRHSQLNVPMDAQYMPSPLTPRYQLAPSGVDESHLNQPVLPPIPTMDSVADDRATSWLDNIDGQSSRSSSRLSYTALNQRNGQLVSDIEAEFDAAMNAAVEAAYEEQPSQDVTPRGAKVVPPGSDRPMAQSKSVSSFPRISAQPVNPLDEELDSEAEDEERLLEEMTREFGLDDPSSKTQPKPSIPRQSDSSGFSSRTWGSSVASTTATAGTALSTLAEATEPMINLPPAPTQSPPKAPARHSRNASQISIRNSVDKHIPIRDRRMSGQSAKQLKIETFSRRDSLSQKPLPIPGPPSDDLNDEPPQPVAENTLQVSPPFLGSSPTPLASIYSGDSTMGESPMTPGLTHINSIGEAAHPLASPTRLTQMMPPPPRPAVHKNISSSSLQKQGLSINTHPSEVVDSPGTPGSALFPTETRRRPSTSTPAATAPSTGILATTSMGGMHLFEDYAGDFGSYKTAGELHPEEPAPLEPCPESFLLRPFWLMRSLYLALSHPHGGFVTQKLFLPREIWRVRNVKIKALEDKISTCDLLTAALQKLSKVDTFDAAALLEEMTSFEAILDQARGTLSKKLGNEVGVAGATSFFKTSSVVEETDLSTPKSANSSAAKSFASWGRKLRSKSSSANLNATAGAREVPSQNFTMPSLPMTTLSSVQTSRSYGKNRNPPPTPSQLPYLLAPMAVYMSTLARLFEAVQVLDSIARQVEDPGLKHSSSTIVGLELTVRNAAEFFAFYIVRFVMSDLLLIVDKFLKKGTEWVMV